MRARAVLCVALVTVGGLASLATAKPKPPAKPVCNLLLDKSSAPDAHAMGTSQLPNDDSLDIKGGDIASNASTLTAVIRVTAWADQDPQEVNTRNLYFEFHAAGSPNPAYLALAHTAVGSTFTYGDLENTSAGLMYIDKGAATGKIVGNEIHISAPLSALASVAKAAPGTKLSGLKIETFTSLGVIVPVDLPVVGSNPGELTAYDTGTGHGSYVAGTPSCITVGA